MSVAYQLEDRTAVITIDDGKANALGHEAVDALSGALDRAVVEASAVLLVGRPGRFCAGYDLATMTASDASMQGPSPKVNCISSRSRNSGLEAAMVPIGWASLPISVTPAPSAGRIRTATRQIRSSRSPRPPWSSAAGSASMSLSRWCSRSEASLTCVSAMSRHTCAWLSVLLPSRTRW